MPKYGPDKIRNVAILGHSREGKTTLAEAMLFATGGLARMGSTDAGTAALDFEPEEQKRKISINLSIAHVEQDGYKVNLLDTPGFFDFVGQVNSALAAAEGALVVVSASASSPSAPRSPGSASTATPPRASSSSTRWTRRTRTSPAPWTRCARSSTPSPWRSTCRSAPRPTSRASST